MSAESPGSTSSAVSPETAPALAPPRVTRAPASRLHVWLHAFRIPTLSAAVVPVLVGTVVAWRHDAFQPVTALAALVGAIAIQIGTNLANDLFDFRKGADTAERIGPPRVLPMGWLSVSDVKAGIVTAFGIATVAGAYLIALRGWPILVIGVASIAAGLAYTAGPWALAYTGLGDVFVFLFFGFVAVVGTYFTQAGTSDPEAVLAAIPIGALATAILVVNNLRDIDTDRRAGKVTLAVRLGRERTRRVYLDLLGVAFAAVPVAVLVADAPAWCLLSLAAAPLAARPIRAVMTREDGPALNSALAGTGALLAAFTVLLSWGLLLAQA